MGIHLKTVGNTVFFIGVLIGQPLLAEVDTGRPSSPDVAYQDGVQQIDLRKPSSVRPIFVSDSHTRQIAPGARVSEESRSQVTSKTKPCAKSRKFRGIFPGARVLVEDQSLDTRMPTPAARVSGEPQLVKERVLEDHFQRLALDLSEKVNSGSLVGEGKVIMRDFVHNSTKERLTISDRLEQGLATALKDLQILSIIEEPQDPTSQKRFRSASTNHNYQGVLDGVYDLDGNGDVLLTVSLQRVENGETKNEASTERAFPGSAFRKEDLADFPKTPPSSFGESRVEEPSDGQPSQGMTKLASKRFLPVPCPNHTRKDYAQELRSWRDPGVFTTKVRVAQEQYVLGEEASFTFQTTRDCYLGAINLGASGNPWLLYPQDGKEPFLVRAGEQGVRIPQRGWLTYQVNGPMGEEGLMTICTTQPISYKAYKKKSQNLLLGKRMNVRDVILVPEKMEWSIAYASFKSLEKGQNEPRGLERLRNRGVLK